MTGVLEPRAAAATNGESAPQSLSRSAARNLATTTKSAPQMQETSPRWLLRRLPWEEVTAGTYRVNRRLNLPVVSGLIGITTQGQRPRVIPEDLCELPLLRGFGDEAALTALADQFQPRELGPGEELTLTGQVGGRVIVVVHGKISQRRPGKFGDDVGVGMLTEGEFVDAGALVPVDPELSCRTVTPCTVLELSRAAIDRVEQLHPSLRDHLHAQAVAPRPATNKRGERLIELSSGHEGEIALPQTFVDYESAPREYELSVAQTVLRVHTRVSDLYSEPMNQTEHQLRLTIEAIRERQEHELINNRDFGLLHNVDPRQRVPTSTGPPTPDDMDALLGRRRKSRLFLAHPRAIATFGRECSRRGVYPKIADIDGTPMPAWRNVPVFPCDKIPIAADNTTSILCMRTGVDDAGVIGLHQPGLPDEYEPSLNVRFMGITEQAIARYLVSAYYSVAVLVPDALGALTSVQIGR